MNAKEFLKSKGELQQPNVRFTLAGEYRTVPLVDLLEAYAAEQSPSQENDSKGASVQPAKKAVPRAKNKKDK